MPVSPSPELDAAIEQLYVALQGYPLPPSMPPCPCCHSVDSERPLYSLNLRKLRPKDLEQYARDALLTWGGVDEFRHFLPRIFEIPTYAEMFRFRSLKSFSRNSTMEFGIRGRNWSSKLFRLS